MIYVYHDLYFFYFKTEEGSPVLLFRKQEAPKRRISHVLAREQGKKSSVKPVYKEDSSFMDAMKTDQKNVSKKSIPQKKIKPQAKMRKPSQDTLKMKRMAEETHSRNDVLQPVTNSFYGEGSFSPVISDDEEKGEKKASAGKKKRVRFAAALESIKEIPSRKSDVWKMVSF